MYRYSSLSKYEMCPAAYKFMIDNTPTLDAAIMQDGSAAHRVYEAYATHCLEAGVDSDITMMPGIAHACGVTPGSALYNAVVAPWLEAGHLFPKSEIIGVEEFIVINRKGEQVEPDAPDAWLHGTIDVLRTVPDDSSAMRIVDYKTGFSSDANPLQMRIYALLVMTAYPHINTVECEFDYTRFNVQRSKTITRDEYEDIWSLVESIVNAIEADTEFAPRPGEHCLTCQWRHACKAAPECVNAIKCDDDARKAVEAISLLQRDLESQKDLLRAWCTERGPVTHNGVTWGHHAQGDDGFDDAKAFVDACDTAGIAQPFVFLSVNNTKAKKLRKRGTWPTPLAEILVNRRNTEFRGKKVGNEEKETCTQQQ